MECLAVILRFVKKASVLRGQKAKVGGIRDGSHDIRHFCMLS